jgi:nucleotide-binding universal stress UspA family protein
MPTLETASGFDVAIQSVMAAVDFSPECEKPLRHAAAIARHFSARLYIAHVVSSLGLTLGGPDAMTAAADLATGEAEQFRHRLAASGRIAADDCRIVISEGEIWEELERIIEQENIDLLVVGTHSRKALSKIVLGSVAEQIFRHASCMVLTVGPYSPPESALAPETQSRPLLFALDFLEGSRQALPYAVSIARQRMENLVFLHMVPPAHGGPASLADMRLRVHEWISQTVGFPEGADIIVEYGEPVEGILRNSERINAEAIIMGLHRRVPVSLSSHLPWSTASSVSCNAGCPVLTIRS